MNVTENLRRRLWEVADFVFPNPCLACSELIAADSGAVGLCRGCFSTLVPAPTPACVGCGRAIHAAVVPKGYACGECRQEDRAYERLLSAWNYQRPIDDILRALKYRRLDYLGPLLAAHLAERFHRELSEVDTVIPVPLHWLRRLKRGFNQAEVIARPLAKHLSVPLCHALTRRRATAPQTGLPRSERRNNLAGVFRPAKPRTILGRRVLLVDDVFTTGATVRAAASVLREAGAEVVYALTVARTPREEPPSGLGTGPDEVI